MVIADATLSGSGGLGGLVSGGAAPGYYLVPFQGIFATRYLDGPYSPGVPGMDGLPKSQVAARQVEIPEGDL